MVSGGVVERWICLSKTRDKVKHGVCRQLSLCVWSVEGVHCEPGENYIELETLSDYNLSTARLPVVC